MQSQYMVFEENWGEYDLLIHEKVFLFTLIVFYEYKVFFSFNYRPYLMILWSYNIYSPILGSIRIIFKNFV